MNAKSLNSAAKALTDILLATSVISTLAVPFAAKFIGAYYGFDTRGTIIFAAMLFTSGAWAAYILYNLRRMFKTLVGNDPFVEENARRLGKIARSCAAIAVIYIIKCVLMFSWATVVIALIFAVGTLFCMVLKNLFTQAVLYKEENDWTV